MVDMEMKAQFLVLTSNPQHPVNYSEASSMHISQQLTVIL